mmetsp:Transcript_31027/g.80815  ORF Transcript_31027/g.80815 Transcript_31027/m.80815 type:complete len:234 (-) Transcript_31027:909-1610(-)
MSLTPHASSVRATAHPSVPAPSSRHLDRDITSTFRVGAARHLISIRLRSTACSANWCELNSGPRSTILGASLPALFASQPTASGTGMSCPGTALSGPGTASHPHQPFGTGGRSTCSSGLWSAFVRPLRSRTHSTCTLSSPQRTATISSALRRGQPGNPGKLQGSENASMTVPFAGKLLPPLPAAGTCPSCRLGASQEPAPVQLVLALACCAVALAGGDRQLGGVLSLWVRRGQ